MATLPPEVTRMLAATATSLVEQLPALGDELLTRLLDEIPELRDDVAVQELLAASARENICMGLDVLAHGIDVTHVEPPAAAAEYARRLAQRGVPVELMLRAYRLGHLCFLEWWLRAMAAEELSVADAIAVIGSVSRMSFEYVDRMSERLIRVYLTEREVWLGSVSAARTAQVRALLAEDGPAADGAEPVLGYRLGGWHVGMIAWLDRPAPGDASRRLTDVVAALAQWSRQAPLTVVCDATSLWVWLPAADGEPVTDAQLEHALRGCDDGVRVAMGSPGRGVSGFRVTHRQARQAQTVAHAAGVHAARVTSFATSSMIAFLAADMDAARTWVCSVLGPLARDEEHAARLRDTVGVFLETKGSFTETAERLHLHKNTVHYRVRKAEEVRGRPLDDDRVGVEVALLACRRLGPSVMQAAGDGSAPHHN